MKYIETRVPPPLVALIFAAGMSGVTKYTLTVTVGPIIKLLIIVGFLILGAYFSVSGVISFRVAKTTVNPFKPESTTSLVTSGVYQRTRNPMYVGFVILLCAWATYLGSIWSLMLIALFMLYIHRFQILPEEKSLEAIFGDEFIAYKNRVRPWL